MKAKRKRRKPGRVASIRASAEDGAVPRLFTLFRPIKKAVTLRLDMDVLEWFKKGGPGYQTRINRALRRVMTEQRKPKA